MKDTVNMDCGKRIHHFGASIGTLGAKSQHSLLHFMMNGMIRIKEINCGRKESLQILSEHRARHSWPGGNMQLSV